MHEPDDELDRLAYAVIGAAIEVHRELGPGFLAAVYEEALAVEFGLRRIPFLRQACVDVVYKGTRVGDGRLDFLVGERLVVEIKATDTLHPVHRAQVLAYLKRVGTPLGLLLNFKCAVMKAGIAGCFSRLGVSASWRFHLGPPAVAPTTRGTLRCAAILFRSRVRPYRDR